MVYEVCLNGNKAGTAEVARKGLYYRISCKCVLPDKDLYRLRVSTGNQRVDLGIYVPVKDGYGVDTMVPVHKLGTRDMLFELVNGETKSEFIPIIPQEPIKRLSQYSNMRFEVRDRRFGVVLVTKR